MRVESFSLRTIYNSRVHPTVEAEVNGHRAAAPSGASTGTYEAHCFVPDDISSAEADVGEAVVGEVLDQEGLDAALRAVDGTDSFADIGAAAIATSFAFAKADGIDTGDTFPYPIGNLVGGGAHGGNTSIQEFLVIPVAAESVPAAMKTLADIYTDFKDRHARRITGINDEGAYVTGMGDEETLKAVKEVADEHEARVGVDMAATEFYDDDAGTYHYEAMGHDLSPDDQVRFVRRLIDRFDLAYVEDPLDESDFERLATLTGETSDTLVVGDDVFVTQQERLERGIAIDAGNSIIVKPNQVGTVTGARETLELAQENGYTPVISHRSGETCDPIIADLALAWNAPLIKAGIAGIRTAKNNQLLRRWDRSPGEMAELPL